MFDKTDGTLFAVKQMDVNKLAAGNLEKYANAETEILPKVRHPYIVSLVFAFQEGDTLNLVMEYCEQGLRNIILFLLLSPRCRIHPIYSHLSYRNFLSC